MRLPKPIHMEMKKYVFIYYILNIIFPVRVCRNHLTRSQENTIRPVHLTISRYVLGLTKVNGVAHMIFSRRLPHLAVLSTTEVKLSVMMERLPDRVLNVNSLTKSSSCFYEPTLLSSAAVYFTRGLLVCHLSSYTPCTRNWSRECRAFKGTQNIVTGNWLFYIFYIQYYQFWFFSFDIFKWWIHLWMRWYAIFFDGSIKARHILLWAWILGIL